LCSFLCSCTVIPSGFVFRIAFLSARSRMVRLRTYVRPPKQTELCLTCSNTAHPTEIRVGIALTNLRIELATPSRSRLAAAAAKPGVGVGRGPKGTSRPACGIVSVQDLQDVLRVPDNCCATPPQPALALLAFRQFLRSSLSLAYISLLGSLCCKSSSPSHYRF